MTPDGERVVADYSWTFNKNESHNCVTRQELLAVVSAIQHIKYDLGDHHFTFRTNHGALQWLMSFKELEGQLARWIEMLQAYDFDVVYTAGTHHGIVSPPLQC